MKSIGVAGIVDTNEDSTAFASAVGEGNTGAVGMSSLQGLQLVSLDLGGRLVGGRSGDLDLGLLSLVVGLGLGLGLVHDRLNWGSGQGLLVLLFRGLGRELHSNKQEGRQVREECRYKYF